MPGYSRFIGHFLVIFFVISSTGTFAQSDTDLSKEELANINCELENPLAKRWSLVFQEILTIHHCVLVENSLVSNAVFFKLALPLPFGWHQRVSITVERAFFSKAVIYPATYAVAIIRDLTDKNPWLEQAVFNAYSEAKKIDYGFMRKLRWEYDSLPWYAQEFEETRKLMGENFWPYGIESRQKTLETLLRQHSHEQGISNKSLSIKV